MNRQMARTSVVKAVFFRLAAAAIIPLVLLGILEGMLSLVGVTTAPLKLVQRGSERYWTANPDYGARIFQRATAPRLAPLWVPDRRAPGEVRLVVLGESAAEGFPLAGFSLAYVLEHAWRQMATGASVRVISLAMTGINSHHVRELGLAAARCLKPDGVILYAGNNEFIGPYGPASVFARFGGPLWSIRLRQRLRNLRVVAVGEELLRRWSPARTTPWRGLQEFQGVYFPPDDPRLETVYRRFRANVRDLVRALTRRGIPVIICTMPVNLADWPPLGGAEALAAFREGQAAMMTGDVTAAWRAFRRACDADPVRIRADSRINEILRSFQGEPGVLLVDVDRAMHEEAGEFENDAKCFYEHVHLTFTGRLMVAASIVTALRDAGYVAASAGGVEEVVQRTAATLLFTPMDEAHALGYVRSMYLHPPFADQPDHNERKERLRNVEREIQREIRSVWNSERLRREWLRVRSLCALDFDRDYRVATWFRRWNDGAAARAALALAWLANPVAPQVRWERARLLLAEGKWDKAGELLTQLRSEFPDSAEVLLSFGELALIRGQVAEARKAFERVRVLRPAEVHAHLFLARMAQDRKAWDEAEALYREALGVAGDHPLLLNNLAAVLLSKSTSGEREVAEAADLAQRAVELDSETPFAWWTLARALARQERWAEAGRAAREAARLAAQAADMRELQETAERQAELWLERARD